MSSKKSDESKTFVTRSGIPVKESYTAQDLPEDLASRLSTPGSYPFTRGVQKTMYRGRLWTMRQYAGFGTAEESNQRYHYLLSQGTMGLSVAFDLPTQLGLDPDHVRSKGEVGKVGVSISNLDEMRTLFKGIPLASVSTSMTINATAPILLSFYVALAEEQGADISQLRGTENLGKNHEGAIWFKRSALTNAQIPFADGRIDADGPATRKQRSAGRSSSACSRFRWHPIFAYEFDG